MMMELFDQDRATLAYGDRRQKEGEARGEAKGRSETIISVARKFIGRGFSIDEAAELTDTPAAELKLMLGLA